MAEVIAAFGALSSFLQLVDFTAKVSVATKELLHSTNNALRENQTSEALAREYGRMVESLPPELRLRGKRVKYEDPSPAETLGKECQKEIERLFHELESLRMVEDAKGPRRIFDGIYKAMRSVSKRKEIERCRRNLQELSGLLATTMLCDLWNQNFGLAQAHMRNPRLNGVDNVGQVRIITERVKIDQLLDSLAIPELASRWQDIEQAWQRTYEWALTDPRHGFQTWLTDNNGIFWISGKAGSGKSTLMKFLYQSAETKSLLHKWAKERRLILASFAFWYAGSSIQKSITGLLMSLLYQILNAVPSLASIAFPEQYAALTTDPDRESDESASASGDEGDLLSTSSIGNDGYGLSRSRRIHIPDWTHQDLVQAINRVVKRGDFGTDSALCLFIDGLDEYQGNHAELVEILRSLAAHSHVKMCVSSRPWNAFRNAFDSSIPQLKLEDLTKPDIKHYVVDRLGPPLVKGRISVAEDSQTEFNLLVDDITQKAEGVFLWVTLVVKSVLEGIDEGDDLSFLRYRVQSLPSDLDAFFQRILSRVNKVYHHQTFQALRLAWLQTDDETHHMTNPCRSFVDYWLIKQDPKGLTDTNFAYHYSSVTLTGEKALKMAVATRSFLSAACKDLLCLPALSKVQASRSLEDARRVEFLHRTVFDYLSTPDMKQQLTAGVPDIFLNGRVLHALNINRLSFHFPGDKATMKQKMLAYVAHRSLAEEHEDLCERYADKFEHYAELVHRSPSDEPIWITDGRALCHLLAFKKAWIVSPILTADQGRKFEVNDPAYSESGADPIWLAAVGELSLNQFPVQQIELQAISALCRCVDKTKSLSVGHAAHPCHKTAWRLFIRKWKLADPPLRDATEADTDEWKNVWKVAMAFIFAIYFAAVQFDEPFCTCVFAESETRRASHDTFSSRDFFKAHVPSEWLLESPYTSSLID